MPIIYNTSIKVPIDDCYMGFGQKLPNTVDVSCGKRLNESQRNKRLHARQGIYVVIFIISLFLDKKELTCFISEIRHELNVLKQQLDITSFREIERMMGLNFNWWELINV